MCADTNGKFERVPLAVLDAAETAAKVVNVTFVASFSRLAGGAGGRGFGRRLERF